MTPSRLTLGRFGQVAILATSALSIWACSEQPSLTSPTRGVKPQATLPAFNVISPVLARASLCPEGPAGTYTYSISLNVPAGYVVEGVPGNYSPADIALVQTPAFETITVGTVSYTIPASNSGASCQTIGAILQSLNFINPVDPTVIQDPLRFLTITQTGAPAGTQLDSILTTEQGGADQKFVAPANTETIDINFFHGAVASYWNSLIPPPPPPGNQGCTPGYWKQSQHFDSWTATGYSPNQLISSVFTVPASYTINGTPEGSFTLVQGLSFKGGNDVSGKAQTLLRAAIAAVLNSSNPAIKYGMSKTDIINAVNAALAGGDATTINDLANTLDGLNNGQGGCPLN
jgi:hypothetical protein